MARAKSEFVAFEVIEMPGDELQFRIAARGFKDTAAVQRWKGKEGVRGHHYVPGCLTGKIETVTIVEKRGLVPYTRFPEGGEVAEPEDE